MPRVNIYIRKDNEDAWKATDNKSALVNGLLEAHFKGYERKTITETAEATRVVEDLGIKIPKEVHEAFKKETIKKISTDPVSTNIRPVIEKAKEKGTCRNGHLLNKFGKCMEKGCKYA